MECINCLKEVSEYNICTRCHNISCNNCAKKVCEKCDASFETYSICRSETGYYLKNDKLTINIIENGIDEPQKQKFIKAILISLIELKDIYPLTINLEINLFGNLDSLIKEKNKIFEQNPYFLTGSSRFSCMSFQKNENEKEIKIYCVPSLFDSEELQGAIVFQLATLIESSNETLDSGMFRFYLEQLVSLLSDVKRTYLQSSGITDMLPPTAEEINVLGNVLNTIQGIFYRYKTAAYLLDRGYHSLEYRYINSVLDELHRLNLEHNLNMGSDLRFSDISENSLLFPVNVLGTVSYFTPFLKSRDSQIKDSGNKLYKKFQENLKEEFKNFPDIVDYLNSIVTDFISEDYTEFGDLFTKFVMSVITHQAKIPESLTSEEGGILTEYYQKDEEARYFYSIGDKKKAYSLSKNNIMALENYIKKVKDRMIKFLLMSLLAHVYCLYAISAEDNELKTLKKEAMKAHINVAEYGIENMDHIPKIKYFNILTHFFHSALLSLQLNDGASYHTYYEKAYELSKKEEFSYTFPFLIKTLVTFVGDETKITEGIEYCKKIEKQFDDNMVKDVPYKKEEFTTTRLLLQGFLNPITNFEDFRKAAELIEKNKEMQDDVGSTFENKLFRLLALGEYHLTLAVNARYNASREKELKEAGNYFVQAYRLTPREISFVAFRMLKVTCLATAISKEVRESSPVKLSDFIDATQKSVSNAKECPHIISKSDSDVDFFDAVIEYLNILDTKKSGTFGSLKLLLILLEKLQSHPSDRYSILLRKVVSDKLNEEILSNRQILEKNPKAYINALEGEHLELAVLACLKGEWNPCNLTKITKGVPQNDIIGFRVIDSNYELLIAECKNIESPLEAGAVRDFTKKLDYLTPKELDKIINEMMIEWKKIDKFSAIIYCKSSPRSGASDEVENYNRNGKFNLRIISGDELITWLKTNLGRKPISL